MNINDLKPKIVNLFESSMIKILDYLYYMFNLSLSGGVISYYWLT